MSTILYNPTDENLEGFHIGNRYIIHPEEKMKVQDKAGRHLLTHLSTRGLVTLEFGDDEAEKAKEGLERNHAFKIKQIGTFNQLNEANKIQGLPYAQPPKAVAEYAKELGVDIKQPYLVENVQVQNQNQIKEENVELRQQMADMQKQLAELVNMKKSASETKVSKTK